MFRHLRAHWLTLVAALLVLQWTIMAWAQEVLPTLPEVVQEVLAQDLTGAFAEVGGLAGITVIAVKLIRVLYNRFRGGDIQGFAAYGLTFVVAVVLGTIGQYAGLVADPQYVDLARPWGGIQFGIAAALSAVGLHQGQRQARSELKARATQLNR